MSIGCQKPVCSKALSSPSLGEPLQRLRSQTVVVLDDIVEHSARQHEEAAVDPAAVALRLFDEGERPGRRRGPDRAEAAGGLYRGHGGELPWAR